MAWDGKERRRHPRPTGTPTYIVEKDAPDWKPPQPFWTKWKREVDRRFRPELYDPYPDHAEPFENLRPLPVPEPKVRWPKPIPHGEVFLMVVGRKNAKMVDLSGGHIDQMDLSKRMTQGWVLNQIKEAVEDVLALDNESDKGQGLAEYALILALIAIVAIVSLILLGGQIADGLADVANQILPGDASPAP